MGWREVEKVKPGITTVVEQTGDSRVAFFGCPCKFYPAGNVGLSTIDEWREDINQGLRY
jgi:hypothetical protein